ncbi:hypothetical protein D3H55_06585 [Bacillus salacetis]|uniref:YwmB family TATA-box binding protein n=1 Tax=Bacillus salacetis TaxID=2315464 RepID=A0A3A1R738_9BACI|nr:YwmB family TATA-box binding protein [Bacillus salacetis]RIW36119.1 hypothetical protein D3H55_06585 [Bacillus salacetis]
MKRYKVLLPALLLGICLMVTAYGKYTIASNQTIDIEKLAAAVEQADGQITEWSLYARENLTFSTDKGFTTFAETMQKENPSYDWVRSQKNEDQEIKGLIRRESGVEIIKMVMTQVDNHYQSYLIYEFRGNNWNHTSEQSIKDHYFPKMRNLFVGEPLLFSCIKGEFSDTLDGVLSKQADELLSILDAEELESLKENDFYSISALSNKFELKVPAKHDNMNLQLGLRNTGLGAQTTFVIGTPILTIEY